MMRDIGMKRLSTRSIFSGRHILFDKSYLAIRLVNVNREICKVRSPRIKNAKEKPVLELKDTEENVYQNM